MRGKEAPTPMRKPSGIAPPPTTTAPVLHNAAAVNRSNGDRVGLLHLHFENSVEEDDVGAERIGCAIGGVGQTFVGEAQVRNRRRVAA